MTTPLSSPQWFRVQGLKPRLRNYIAVHRHEYQGVSWFILENKVSGRHHRFNTTAFKLIGLLDGNRTINDAWQLLNAQLGDFAPTQDEVILWLGRLYDADLLEAKVAMAGETIFKRREQDKKLQIKQLLASPFSQKIPLWDPDAFLERHLAQVNRLFNWVTAITGLLVILLASLLAAMHWQALTQQVAVNALSPYNLCLLFVVYPWIKIAHELGHAFTAKLEGGEVHELGVTFLMFVPIPYVNISTIKTFRNKYKRMLASAAGMLVELFLASLALFVWLGVAPGLMRDIAFNIMLVGGISTLFFNGNPLLKYDGYYVLADALEIPNLFQRSASYWVYLAQRYVLGLKNRESPAYSLWESGWFILYRPLSFCYGMALLWFLIIYLIDTFFVIGVILALWVVSVQIMVPLYNMLSFIVNNRNLRSVSRFGALLAAVLIAVFIVPFPYFTVAEGLVWVPDKAQLRAESAGFCGSLYLSVGSQVQSGVNILTLEDPFLNMQVAIQQSKLKELEASYRAEKAEDSVKAQIIKVQIPAALAELEHAQKHVQSMQIKSATAGQLLIPEVEDLPGQFIKQGELIGYVLTPSLPVVRTVITQRDIGKLHADKVQIQIRLANDFDRIMPAKILRVIPEATNYLPGAALASTYGGNMILDPARKSGLQTLEPFFLVDVEFMPSEANNFLGTRAYVRFNHGKKTLAKQWYTSLQQLFLSQFNV